MVIGQLLETTKEIEWKIENFFCLTEADVFYRSKSFYYGNTGWFLQIYPNGYAPDGTVGFVDVVLYKEPCPTLISVDVSLSLKTVHGEKELERNARVILDDGDEACYFDKFVSGINLLERKSELMPSGSLTLVFSMKTPESSENERAVVECSVCKRSSNDDDKDESSFPKKKRCMDRPIKCPDCFELIFLRNWHDHECTAKIKAIKSLGQDYKKVLLEGSNYDIKFKVGNKEFHAHQDILKARSQVFWSMLSHGMAEKNCGIIDVADSDPEAMEQFLFYIYSGKVEKMDQSSVVGLYYLADKYEVYGLRNDCSDFMKKSLCPNNICEIINLAIQYSDHSLQDIASEYFINNMIDILQTAKWQAFIKDNFTIANELLIKSQKQKRY